MAICWKIAGGASIGFDVYWWTDDIALEGVDAKFWLTDYIPVTSVEVGVELETEVSP